MDEEEMPARRRLSRERVVAAALRIVDRDGLEGLTMRALGRELGVDPMAVYHWVANKDELLGLIVEAVYAEIPLDPALLPGGDWRERFAYAAGVFARRASEQGGRVPRMGRAGRPGANRGVGLFRGVGPARMVEQHRRLQWFAPSGVSCALAVIDVGVMTID